MNYAETLDYLYAKLPMFTRVGAVALKKDLYNTIAMCGRLGNPQDKFKSIHVAGTNGKGSTSHMLAAILQQAGYKTGLYTSPHLKDFRERIRINGEMVTEDFVVDFVQQQQGTIEQVSPSFFEVTVAMAFSYFAKEQVDIAIIEVGLGGRLDSTNIITPELSVITNISLDHTHILGNSLAEIAFEKAGIIKPRIPVVIGETQEETARIFQQKAKEENSKIIFADQELGITKSLMLNEYLSLSVTERSRGAQRSQRSQRSQLLFEDLQLDLTGSYQQKNILTVIQTIQTLRSLGFSIEEMAVYTALKNVKHLTGLQGRWQTLSKNPLIICDTGHNTAGITEVIKNINSTPYQHLHIVIGMVKDKDISAVLKLLPQNASYYFCMPQLERALPAKELAAEAALYQLKGDVFARVGDALTEAKKNARTDDLIFVGGSTFVVAEVI